MYQEHTAAEEPGTALEFATLCVGDKGYEVICANNPSVRWNLIEEFCSRHSIFMAVSFDPSPSIKHNYAVSVRTRDNEQVSYCKDLGYAAMSALVSWVKAEKPENTKGENHG